ncbi:DJ-1/PfpI family protein [Corynebacterium lipophiloflavum]|uniref:DJ-1/PfpI family protein n=1 Tax=Corynebacterium lipophiloflavum (strain ATCC 700352 / DSM 44291 / CCUG 37336 / JCM 10383 / DMMZ 1944) TaxID=525263 RepID=C0XUC8_CORLD|nr:DJ-1/PfpI family protein [Corynebacterium lipophiloflavum]EEI16194.1 DJ-1/PfpI family protein [Corynebacterium lipophiloflavum DSM 44291]
MKSSATQRRLTVVLFEGFELLDVFGPLELFAHVPAMRIELVADKPGAVRSAQGIDVIAELGHVDVEDPDILMVPGGIGTRKLVLDKAFLSWLYEVGQRCQVVSSVCTGSALLAAAGLLEGYRATSNKLAFEWAASFGDQVVWEREARWVEDGSRWTSSGVTAGMDMSAALIRRIFGQEVETEVVTRIEYQPHRDSTNDPFFAGAKER